MPSVVLADPVVLVSRKIHDCETMIVHLREREQKTMSATG
jgi:hypothetical protein